MGVVELWSSLFNENRIIWSMRRIWNINFGAVWKTLDRFINDSRFEISIFKVKSHSNNLGNDLADGLCKAALLDKAKMEGLTVKLISTMIIHGNTQYFGKIR